MLNGMWHLAPVYMKGRSFSSEHSASVSMAALRKSCICVSETLDPMILKGLKDLTRTNPSGLLNEGGTATKLQ